MSMHLIIDEKTKAIAAVVDGTSYTAEVQAKNLAGNSERSLLICQVLMRVSSAPKIEVETDLYPNGLFGESVDAPTDDHAQAA